MVQRKHVHNRKRRPVRYDTRPLAAERDRQGLTNTQIAAAVRRSVSIVTRTLSDDPSYKGPGTVAAIAQFLRVPMEDVHVPARESGRSIRNPQSAIRNASEVLA